MKILIFAASLLIVTSAAIAADVGVSVSIGQPGFYGRIDIGDIPQPRVVYAEPVIIRRLARHVDQQPVYMRVPPGHARNWSKHCGKYGACSQRVYFVQDRWYTNEYAPRYRERQARYENARNDRQHNHERETRQEKHRENDKHDRGHGHGNGKH